MQECNLLFKNEPIPASFCLFLSFSRYNFNTNWKKCRWCAWDLNPGPQDGRRRRNHWAMAATLNVTCLAIPKTSVCESVAITWQSIFDDRLTKTCEQRGQPNSSGSVFAYLPSSFEYPYFFIFICFTLTPSFFPIDKLKELTLRKREESIHISWGKNGWKRKKI